MAPSKTKDVKSSLGNGVPKDEPSAAHLSKTVPHPELPQADKAPSAENSDPKTTGKLSVLEAHLAYYDFDHDGVIYPLDVYKGFHQTGFNWFLSIIAVFVICGSFSYFTQDTWLPDPLFSIKIKNVHRTKHGSDSETYDAEGRFLPAKFEEIFSKHATEKDVLTLKDIWRMLVANRNINDPFGWTAAFLEWGALYWVAADDNGKLSKERVRACFDGSLWPILEAENKSKKAAAKANKAQRRVFAKSASKAE